MKLAEQRALLLLCLPTWVIAHHTIILNCPLCAVGACHMQECRILSLRSHSTHLQRFILIVPCHAWVAQWCSGWCSRSQRSHGSDQAFSCLMFTFSSCLLPSRCSSFFPQSRGMRVRLVNWCESVCSVWFSVSVGPCAGMFGVIISCPTHRGLEFTYSSHCLRLALLVRGGKKDSLADWNVPRQFSDLVGLSQLSHSYPITGC